MNKLNSGISITNFNITNKSNTFLDSVKVKSDGSLDFYVDCGVYLNDEFINKAYEFRPNNYIFCNVLSAGKQPQYYLAQRYIKLPLDSSTIFFGYHIVIDSVQVKQLLEFSDEIEIQLSYTTSNEAHAGFGEMLRFGEFFKTIIPINAEGSIKNG